MGSDIFLFGNPSQPRAQVRLRQEMESPLGGHLQVIFRIENLRPPLQRLADRSQVVPSSAPLQSQVKRLAKLLSISWISCPG